MARKIARGGAGYDGKYDSPSYPTNLSDAEWALVEPHLPSPCPTGRPRKHTLRAIVDAILYLARAGCAWRMLPHEFPPWKTVFHYFRRWRLAATYRRQQQRPITPRE
jgi:putative transposase